MSAEPAQVPAEGGTGLHELVVDGVRVFHQPGPSKTRAVLFFGVGLQDESFETIGLTHLVEHVAMAELPKTHLESNGTVTVDHTAFFAHGRPDEVGAFLRRVCAGLADPPLEHFEREKDVVAAEDSVGADLTLAAAWSARYGFEGAGLVATPGYGPFVHTREDALAHLAAHFTAGRAALGVHGPLPEGLSLPLRPGVAPAPGGRAPRRYPTPRLGEGPEWVEDAPSPGVALLLDGSEPEDYAARVAHTVLHDRLVDVEHDHATLSFSLSTEFMGGPDGDVFTLAVDVPEATAGEVALLVWEQLNDLAEHGPTRAELDDVLAAYADQVDPTDDDVAENEPFRHAAETALAIAAGRQGVTPLTQIAADVARTTREDVRDRLATAARRALLVLPEGVHLPDSAQRVAPITRRSWCPEAPELPPGQRLRPSLLRRLRRTCADRTLVLGEDCLAQQDEWGVVHVVRWDDVVGVVEVDGGPGVVVLGRGTCHIRVHPHCYGRATHAEVLRRLAPHVERMRRAART